jgi:DNA gyrase subunit A
LTSLSPASCGLAVGTAHGVVKRVATDYPGNKDDWQIIGLKDNDAVVGAVELRNGEQDLVFITSDAQLLHFPAAVVRPQGRTAAGMAGIKLADGAHVVFFGALDPHQDNLVVTSSGSSGALPGTEPGSLKVTAFAEYPAKGRATAGVRCHRFLRGEDTLILGWAGGAPATAAAANGVALQLPEATGKRDGSGVPAATPIHAIAGPLPEPTGLPPRSLPDPTTDDLVLSLDLETTPEFPAGKQ